MQSSRTEEGNYTIAVGYAGGGSVGVHLVDVLRGVAGHRLLPKCLARSFFDAEGVANFLPLRTQQLGRVCRPSELGMTGLDRAGYLPDNHGGIPIGGYVDLTGHARTFGTAEACPIFSYNKFSSPYENKGQELFMVFDINLVIGCIKHVFVCAIY